MNEFEIIEHYFKNLTVEDPRIIYGVGDDAAVINIPEGYELVVSVDTLVSGVHFTADADPESLGYKSLAVNLSDLAAMGAVPAWATMALTIPEYTPPWIEGFASGFSELAKRYPLSLIGGDLTQGPLSITVQIMGVVESGTSMLRNGARTHDDVYVSGYPGEAGYALLAQKREFDDCTIVGGHCLERLLKPLPRVELGRKIRGIASAAIDISDGLAADLGHILKSSSVGAIIELDKIPLREPLAGLMNQDEIWEVVLSSGDDYELCFTVPGAVRREMEEIAMSFDFPVTRIGKIVADKGLHLMSPDGNKYLIKRYGYEHF